MDMQKFTQKSLEALSSAQKLAEEYGNQAIKQTHVLYSLLNAENGLISQLMTKMNIDFASVSSDALSLISRYPKVTGGQIYISTELSNALEAAEKQAGAMKDSYISVEPPVLRIA